MEISAKMVKELREKTGAGMMDCKKALTETDGDVEKAIDLLRKKGAAKAARKADRIAAEGLTYIKVDGHTGVIVEVNSETDFVAKNNDFKNLIEKIADVLLSSRPQSVEEALTQTAGDSQETVRDIITNAAAKIGEKLSLRRFQIVEKQDTDTFGTYLHMGGRISVLAVLSGENKQEAAKNIAMHIAAANPCYISREDVPQDEVEREKDVLKQQAAGEGKPEHIVDKMVQGRLNKYFEQICLLDQPYVKDSDRKVAKYVKSEDSAVLAFVRFEVGEGMEKREENFAEEVQSQIRH